MGKSTHAISGVFVFLLLGIFAVFSTVMVLMSAKAYKGMVDESALHNSVRVASSYIRTMLRGNDESGVLKVEDVPDAFHARYSCKGKEYVYKVWNSRVRNPFMQGMALHYRYDMDVEMLNREAQAFVGAHDFTSFCTLDKREKGDFTRTVKYFTVQREGDLVTFTVAADGFLYNMVRIMVGTLLAMNNGRIPFGTLSDIIKAENRKCAGPTAPACGLYLNKVFYDDHE